MSVKGWRRKTETGKLTQSFKLRTLPPNLALEQNILRVHLQCTYWLSSLNSDPPLRYIKARLDQR